MVMCRNKQVDEDLIQRKVIHVTFDVEILDDQISYTKTGAMMDKIENDIAKIQIQGGIVFRPNVEVRYDYFEPLDHS